MILPPSSRQPLIAPPPLRGGGSGAWRPADHQDWTTTCGTQGQPTIWISLQLQLLKYLSNIYLGERLPAWGRAKREAPSGGLALPLGSGAILLGPKCAQPTQPNHSPQIAGPMSVKGSFVISCCDKGRGVLQRIRGKDSVPISSSL